MENGKYLFSKQSTVSCTKDKDTNIWEVYETQFEIFQGCFVWLEVNLWDQVQVHAFTVLHLL